MLVKIFDQNLQFQEKYETPSGFQLEQYIRNLHPKSDLCIRLLDDEDFYRKTKFLGDIYEYIKS